MSDTPPPEMAPEMAPNLDALERAALAALAGAEAASLEAWRVAYLGRKGALREAMRPSGPPQWQGRHCGSPRCCRAPEAGARSIRRSGVP